jgi:hypothetical protein
MDELFRFSIIRSAASVPDGSGISLESGSAFQSRLAEVARQTALARPFIGVPSTSNLIRTAEDYLGSPSFVSDPARLQLGPQWVAFRKDLAANPPAGAAQVDAAVQNAFGVNAAALSADPRFAADEVSAKDALTAGYVAPKGHRIDLSELAQIVRETALIRGAAARDPRLADAEGVADAEEAPLVVPATVLPQSGTTIRPAGITDLLVVRQHINRYEKGEIQAIENVMLGEIRRKTARDQTTTQTTTTTESDTTTHVTKEADQTERFSLQTEVNKALQEQLAVKAGASVSYHGGSVDASVNASVDYSQAKSESQKIASDYAREVVSKAVTEVTTQVKQQLVQQFTQVLETLEDHTFDNSGGKGHISAVYQWLNKVYTAQIFNYGVRQIYDVIVPEPALQWIVAFANLPNPSGISPEPPPDFTACPDAITPANYEVLAKTYRAGSVPAPPPAFQEAAATAIMTRDQPATDALVAIKIPEGYVARTAWLSCEYDWSNSSNILLVLLGETQVPFQQNEVPKSVALKLMGSGDVPCSIHAYNISNYSVSIRIQCELQPEALLAWKLQVFDKVLAGWASWKAEYQDAKSKLQQAIEAVGDPKLGGNPDENRAVERTELKRSVLQLLLGKFNLSGVDDPTGRPHPKLPDAVTQGEYVRFFERAFEWEQISYVLYPYFWGDDQRWLEKLRLSTDDPMFEAFLRAGSARVVVAVRPGFEGALDYFFSMGQLWNGGGPPPVDSPLYLPISQEIRERTGAPGKEVPYGDSWEVMLPTSLIKLRSDDKLPTWTWPDHTKWEWADGAAVD